jgi:type IV pilus assembly protein PilE
MMTRSVLPSAVGVNRQAGFTLIELMIVLAVAAIIMAIAVPAYNDQVRKSRRSEALTQIENLRMLQERWRSNNTTYATAAQLGGVPTNDHYVFTITPAVPTATTYTITGTAQGDQTADKSKGSSCTTLSIDQAGTKSPAACW